ncbi:hypothetical protein AZE42_12963 [Rhizopogon vesiculosus]|uniref:Uncharacterized protein n=1 Tax=Rhizopogon vesiculosus TaxID=180088 RepID=A0A1J8Q6C1_9AGAM|nr:hypothetical protein AZE42_12963 [Rhizopogon vesiculosus]
MAFHLRPPYLFGPFIWPFLRVSLCPQRPIPLSIDMSHWPSIAAEKRQRQLKSIPQDWLVSPPPDSTLDVTGFPETCGLLNARDTEITNTSTDVLLEKLASGEWTSVDVTTAFYKRAIIAHQLVSDIP